MKGQKRHANANSHPRRDVMTILISDRIAIQSKKKITRTLHMDERVN